MHHVGLPQRHAGLRAISLGRGLGASLGGSPALVTSSPGGRSSRSGAAGGGGDHSSQDTSFAEQPMSGALPSWGGPSPHCAGVHASLSRLAQLL